MAEMAGDPYGYDERPGSGWRRQAAGALGGAVAIAVIWGLVSWGHGLLTRDSGQIPFLRAEEGPMKVLPEDPGGMKIEGADRAVSRILGDDPDAPAALAPAPETLAEVPVSAELRGLGRIHGVIDRLILAPDHVLAVDFKSNRVVPSAPADTPEGLLRQMGAYAAALAQVYPDRRIETGLIWTTTAHYMPLSHEDVTLALARATLA